MPLPKEETTPPVINTNRVMELHNTQKIQVSPSGKSKRNQRFTRSDSLALYFPTGAAGKDDPAGTEV